MASTTIVRFNGRQIYDSSFTRRPRRDKKVYLGLVVIVGLAATQIGAGIAQTIILSRLRPSFKAQDAKVMTSTIIQTAGSLLCDVAITGHLYLTLNRMKNLHSYPDTYRDRANRKFVDSTTVWIVNRGAITASVSGVTMALFLRWPDTFWFVLTLAPCSKLYMNGMLAILNVRDYLRENLFKGNHQEPGVEGAEVVDPREFGGHH